MRPASVIGGSIAGPWRGIRFGCMRGQGEDGHETEDRHASAARGDPSGATAMSCQCAKSFRSYKVALNHSPNIGVLNTLDRWPPYLFALAAATCFVLMIVFAFKDKLKAATLLATVFFVSVILGYFPQLDSIAAFSINVKLHNNLERAEEILKQLRDLAALNAKSSYFAMTWNNLWGRPSAKDKQTILDEIDQQLTALKVTEEERHAMTRQYVQLIGVELYGIFASVIERYIQWKEDHLPKGTPNEIAEARQFTNSVAKWRSSAYLEGSISKFSNLDLMARLQAVTPNDVLDANEKKKTQQFADEIVQLYTGCKTKGGYTREAAQFVDTYGVGTGGIVGTDKKLTEVFGVTMALQ
jgi:hypothetical protein